MNAQIKGSPSSAGKNTLPMTLPECPCGHGTMHPRDLKQQTPEQLFCGAWYDCHKCHSSVLFTSVELEAQHREQAIAYKPHGLKCAMRADCCNEITHIDTKGFTLCAEHSTLAKRNGKRNRKLRAWECDLLRANLPITYELRSRSVSSSSSDLNR